MKKLKSSWKIIAASLLTVFQYILTFWDYELSGILFLQWLGWAFWLLSVYFGFAPIFIFRKLGGVARGKSYVQTTKLVDTQLYAIVRHPQYLAGILLNLTMFLLAQKWLVLLPGIISVWLIYWDIQDADQEGIEKFGEAYREYMQRTPQINFFVGLIQQIHRGKK